VWWIPQVPGYPFHVPVGTVEEGVKIMDVLAKYDLFQYNNHIKGDYANVGGLEQWNANSDGEGTPGWCSWMDEETGIDDPREYLDQKEEA
jgi:hypothetical protein